MKTALSLIIALFAVAGSVHAQLYIMMKDAPFYREKLRADSPTNIEAVLSDPDLIAEEYNFQLYVQDGDGIRTLQSQVGPKWWMPVTLYYIPSVPEPQVAVTVRVRHKYSGTSYTLTQSAPIQFISSDLKFMELKPSGWGFYPNLIPKIVGWEQGAIYDLFTVQPKRTREIIWQIGPMGDTIKRKEVKGNPYISQATTDTVYSKNWPGARRLRATMFYEGGPSDGYTIESSIPDSMPEFSVEASLGFGPFKAGVDQFNTFVVKGLGAMCDSVIWTIQYETDNGMVRTPLRITRPYDATKDSMHVVLNMRDISPRSALVVTAKYGIFLPEIRKSYPLLIEKSAPSFRITGRLPLIPGVDGIDTVTVDSLPPRILNVKMQLSSGSGAIVRETNVSRIAPAYIRSVSLPIDRRTLSLGTYVIRVRALNDFMDDGTDYFFGIDVRDTSKVFLVADSWGPFTRGDSGTITPAVTDIRPVVGPKPDRVLGRFTLVDTLIPDRPLYVSVPVDLSDVRSRDSVVHCPDSSYSFGDSRYRRARLQTINLPFTAHMRFERLIVRGKDTTRDQVVEHPIFAVPSPGTLTTVPRLDTAFTVTRNQPLTLTLSDIVPEATGVRFSLYGMKDSDPAIEQIIPRAPGQQSVSCTVDAGLLPVNAKVVVTVITPLANDVGASITRIIRTEPDTLAMSANPPIDNLLLEWSRDPATRQITGINPYTSKLTFTKIPAQTRSIQVLSFNDQGGIIDSVTLWVPYRTKYDPTLKAETYFTFRAMNTAGLQVRYLSDGGPSGGLRYTRGIATYQYDPGMLTVEKMNLRTAPPSVDGSPILQGSTDVVALTMRWGQGSPSAWNTPSGYSKTLKIDSVRMEITDCAGNIVDRQLIAPHPPVQSGGVIADTMYPIRKLPLSTARVTFRLYSKSMTLPATGIVYSAPLSLQTNPVVNIPFGTSYPTYRVNDTVSGTLKQSMTITNTNGVTSIVGLRLEGRFGSVAQWPLLRPVGDSIRLPEFDFNTLEPEGSPYKLSGNVFTSTCSRDSATDYVFATISVTRVAERPAAINWIYSSKGWGPFQQGRAPQTEIVANVKLAPLVKNRGGLADSLEVSIIGWSSWAKTFTPEVPQKYSYPLLTPLPESVKVRGTINLSPFDSTSFITIHVKWFRRNLNGASLALDTLIRYPVSMVPFPDQLIEAETEGYEQSVLAGSTGPQVMKDLYDFAMRPQSSSINRLRFTFLSTTQNVLDTFSLFPASRNLKDSTSVFEMKHDVAQYPWPYIARERDKIDIEIGYQFEGASKATKIQKTGISILPRAEWLNGNTAVLDGSATQTSIPISVTIPMPSSSYKVNAPMFDSVNYSLGNVDPSKTANLTVRASYNPETRQFTMLSSPDSKGFWTPSVSLFGAGKNTASSIAKDGESGPEEFEALYRFERAALADNSDTVDNRELRIRSMYSSTYGGVVGAFKWIKGLAKSIGEVAKLGSAAATGGLLWVEPYFSLDANVRHLSISNIGTEAEGSLLHLTGEEPLSKNTEANEFPTSHAMGLTIAGGGGVEVSFIGLLGLGVGVSNEYLFGSGSTFANSIMERTSRYYPTALDLSQWFNIELSLLWGLIKVELFHGRYIHDYDPRLMPSFLKFDESIGSVFKKGSMQKTGEATQNASVIGRLPAELPFYRPSPSLDANTKTLVVVHLEQSLLGSNGQVILSSLDRKTHSLLQTTTIVNNRNGIHDPHVTLCGNGGSAFIGWAQSSMSATTTYGVDDAVDLLRNEDAFAAFYDATTQSVQQLPPPDDEYRALLDGPPVIAVSPDTVHAMMAWNAMYDSTTYTDVYIRPITRDTAGWSFGTARPVLQVPGVCRDVQIEALEDGTYVIAWLNDVEDGTGVRVITATLSQDGTSSITRVFDDKSREVGSDLKMVGNGKEIALLFASSSQADSAEFQRSLYIARYQGQSWSEPVRIDAGKGRGLLRHVEGDLSEDGSFFVTIDAFDHQTESGLTHRVAACVGSVYDSPSLWRVFENSTVMSPRDRDVWSMSAAIGPDATLYVATQELDSLRSNQQAYGTGLQLGPARCNAVVRAFTLDDKGNVTSRPFGNAPTSVEETEADRLEATLRYRVQVLDPAPNPAREACVVPLAVQKPTRITVQLVDELGRNVLTIYEGMISTGMQGVSFETSSLNSGHYTVIVTDEAGVAGSAPVVVIR